MKIKIIKLASFVCICIIFILSNTACAKSKDTSNQIESEPIVISIKEKQNITETISELITALRKGNFEVVKTKFAPSSKDDILDNLESEQANQLADWIEKGKLIKNKPKYKVYRSEWIDENGAKNHVEFIFSLNRSGDWVIISW
jgi:predicted CopG family antitoxin